MRQLERMIERLGAVDCSVLVTGETGSGKEEVARAIHAGGRRADGPFIAVNCGALVSSLAESQLFGHERGAFTGASSGALGAFRAADGGVLFLDEIGEMPTDLQPILLRVLQHHEVIPVGASHPVSIDVQVIAATNRTLDSEVAAGRFREDLLFRLNTIHVDVPPLRERSEDIPALIAHFSRHHAERFRRPTWQPDADTLARLVRCPWPGNVRQLAQFVERMYVLGDDAEEAIAELANEVRTARALPQPLPAPPSARPAADPILPVLDLGELRRIAVRQALAQCNGRRGEAAKLLRVSRNTMTKLIAEACPEAAISRVGQPKHPSR